MSANHHQSSPPQKPCKYIAQGKKCTYGENCHFNHQVCKFHLSGSCTKGVDCKLVHLNRKPNQNNNHNNHNNNHNNHNNHHHRTTVEKVATIQKKERTLHMTFLVHVSGSMAERCREGNQNRLEAALEGVGMIFEKVLKPTDLVTLIAFDNNIHVIVPRKKKSQLQFDDLRRRILALDRGCTAMWDGICEALNNMPAKDLDLQREFIILTDGEDNCSSSSSRQQSTQKLMEPGIAHFHALFIGIDMGSSASKPIKDLCAQKPHLNYVGVENSANAIKRAYMKSEAYQIRVTRIKKETVLLCPVCEKPGHNSAQCRVAKKK